MFIFFLALSSLLLSKRYRCHLSCSPWHVLNILHLLGSYLVVELSHYLCKHVPVLFFHQPLHIFVITLAQRYYSICRFMISIHKFTSLFHLYEHSSTVFSRESVRIWSESYWLLSCHVGEPLKTIFQLLIYTFTNDFGHTALFNFMDIKGVILKSLHFDMILYCDVYRLHFLVLCTVICWQYNNTSIQKLCEFANSSCLFSSNLIFDFNWKVWYKIDLQ